MLIHTLFPTGHHDAGHSVARRLLKFHTYNHCSTRTNLDILIPTRMHIPSVSLVLHAICHLPRTEGAQIGEEVPTEEAMISQDHSQEEALTLIGAAGRHITAIDFTSILRILLTMSLMSENYAYGVPI